MIDNDYCSHDYFSPCIHDMLTEIGQQHALKIMAADALNHKRH